MNSETPNQAKNILLGSLIVSVLTLGVLYCGRLLFLNQEANQEGVVMLSASMEYDKRVFPEPEVIKHRGHSFLCLTTPEGNVTIMLDAKYSSYYKQLPWERSYVIPRKTYESIVQSHNASRTVLKVLETHLAKDAAESKSEGLRDASK